MTSPSAAALAPPPGLTSSHVPGGRRKQVPGNTFLARYDHIIDFMLANPTATLRDIANYVGYSYTWVSLVRSSDAFKARYEQRRAAMNTDLSEAVTDRLHRATVESLDIFLERLHEKRDVVKLSEALDAADTLLQRMGYGIKQNGTQVNVQQVAAPQATAEEIARARARMRSAEQGHFSRAAEGGGPTKTIEAGDARTAQAPALDLKPNADDS